MHFLGFITVGVECHVKKSIIGTVRTNSNIEIVPLSKCFQRSYKFNLKSKQRRYLEIPHLVLQNVYSEIPIYYKLDNHQTEIKFSQITRHTELEYNKSIFDVVKLII